jgi:glucan 1,3-beta-glucosidase
MCFLPRLLASLGVLSLFPAVLSLNFGFPYGAQKVRGVNLGGWLVLEVQ